MSGIDGRDVMALIAELKHLVAVQKQIAERLDWLVKEVRASNQLKKEEPKDERNETHA